jgi:hypothetical protein
MKIFLRPQGDLSGVSCGRAAAEPADGGRPLLPARVQPSPPLLHQAGHSGWRGGEIFIFLFAKKSPKNAAGNHTFLLEDHAESEKIGEKLRKNLE